MVEEDIFFLNVTVLWQYSVFFKNISDLTFITVIKVVNTSTRINWSYMKTLIWCSKMLLLFSSSNLQAQRIQKHTLKPKLLLLSYLQPTINDPDLDLGYYNIVRRWSGRFSIVRVIVRNSSWTHSRCLTKRTKNIMICNWYFLG